MIRKSLLALLSVIVALALKPGLGLAGTLSGNLTRIVPGTVINLTDTGNLDWVHWGYDPTNAFNHKVGASLIGNFSLIGSNLPSQYGTNLHGYSWTNGEPVATVTNTMTEVLLVGVTNEFLITDPADT